MLAPVTTMVTTIRDPDTIAIPEICVYAVDLAFRSHTGGTTQPHRTDRLPSDPLSRKYDRRAYCRMAVHGKDMASLCMLIQMGLKMVHGPGITTRVSSYLLSLWRRELRSQLQLFVLLFEKTSACVPAFTSRGAPGRGRQSASTQEDMPMCCRWRFSSSAMMRSASLGSMALMVLTLRA